MLTNEAGQPIKLKQHWQLYDRTWRPLSWDWLRSRNEAWHERDDRKHAPREMRPDLGRARGIVLTEAGREYLASLRAGVK